MIFIKPFRFIDGDDLRIILTDFRALDNFTRPGLPYQTLLLILKHC